MLRHLKVVVYTAFCLIGLLVKTPTALSAEQKRPPNILFILADDVGHNVLGCYGGESFRTPHLDQLARAGMRYDHCYSMPSCHPTRVCLLTGRYPHRIGNPRWGSFPPEYESRTMAQVLKSAGYATAVAGKWQITMLGKDLQHPYKLGFDEYSLFGWHEGPRYYDPLIWSNGKQLEKTAGKYGPDLYCEFMIDFMRRNKEKPFFVFYSMALCHDVTDDLKAPVPHGPHDRYDNLKEMAEAMDGRVGRLMKALQQLGIADNTVVVFTGDNGTSKQFISKAVGDKLIREPITYRAGGREVRGGKTELTDGGTRVPLLVRWPGHVQANSHSDTLVDMSDFLPTFAAFAGSQVPAGWDVDGQSFTDSMQGKESPDRKLAFAEAKQRMWVRDTRWKLYDDGRLFDILNDEFERQPVQQAAANSPAENARRKLATAMTKVKQRAN